MKAFYATVTLFCMTILLILSNSAQVADFTNSTKESLNNLIFSESDHFIKETESLAKAVRSQISSVEFSIPHSKTSVLFQSLDLLTVYAKAGDKKGFNATRSDLLNILSEIADLERISFFGIL